jgi:hypothetical protein
MRDLPRGVYKRKNGRFRATIRLNGIQVYIGDFETPAEASTAFQKRRHELPAKFKWGEREKHLTIKKEEKIEIQLGHPITIKVNPARLTPDQRMGLAILLSKHHE